MPHLHPLNKYLQCNFTVVKFTNFDHSDSNYFPLDYFGDYVFSFSSFNMDFLKCPKYCVPDSVVLFHVGSCILRRRINHVFLFKLQFCIWRYQGCNVIVRRSKADGSRGLWCLLPGKSRVWMSVLRHWSSNIWLRILSNLNIHAVVTLISVFRNQRLSHLLVSF